MRWLVVPVMLVLASSAQAGSGFFKNFVVVDQGSGDAYYDTVGAVANTTDFNNLDLGSYCPNGTPLYLSGGEANTFQDGGDFIDSAQLIWTTYEAGNRPFSPFFSNLFLNFQFEVFNGFGGVDKQWRTTGAGIDLTTGQAAGTYSLEVYFEGQGFNNGFGFNIFDSNGGVNYVASYTVTADPDGDCVDVGDNCPNVANADQADSDFDGVGDVCDVCPGGDDSLDADNDGVCDFLDECAGFDDGVDTDSDGIADGCDACPLDATGDSDSDGVCDSDDACPGSDDTVDTDSDGVADGCDACPLDINDDSDNDDVCDSDDACAGFDDNADSDADSVADGCDVCPGGDDAADADSDGVCDFFDVCPGFDDGTDADTDGIPDGCDVCPVDAPDDSDGDGVCDSDDVCPGSDDDADADGDGVPDGCDVCPADSPDDSDSDGVCDSDDVCPGADDGADADSDGFADGCDNCPNDANPQQEDADSNGIGDACDVSNTDSDGDGVTDADDLCDGTTLGAAVDADGCSGNQILESLCPCDDDWKNHGGYVSCVAQAAEDLVDDGLFTDADKDAATSAAGGSSCGKKNR